MNNSTLDIDDVLALLDRALIGPTQADQARRLGISPQYLCDILKGRKEPGPLVLEALGLERVVGYRYVKTAPTRISVR